MGIRNERKETFSAKYAEVVQRQGHFQSHSYVECEALPHDSYLIVFLAVQIISAESRLCIFTEIYIHKCLEMFSVRFCRCQIHIFSAHYARTTINGCVLYNRIRH